MKYIAAYLLAQLGGETAPSQEKIAQILATVGITADEAALKAVLARFEGKDIEATIEAGASKLVATGGAAPAAAAAAGEAAPVEEAKKEEEAAVEVNLGDMFDW